MHLSQQKIKEEIKTLGSREMKCFDDYYDIATKLDEIIETCDLHIDEWVSLHDINEKVLAFEKNLTDKDIDNERQ